ncbi:MAG: hypothetical protein WD557_18305 [Dehalococcoidia bacterium]
MNLLSALAPTSVAVDPLEWPAQKVQMAAAIKALTVQQDMAKLVVQLLDPAIGTRLNVKA